MKLFFISGIAFQVATSLTSPQKPVRFEEVLINFGHAYDPSVNKFCAKKKGFYWFHVDTFTDENLYAHYSVIDENEHSIIRLRKLNFAASYQEIDVLSQDAIVELDIMTCLQTMSSFATSDITSSLYLMTWAGFFIDSDVIFSLVTSEEATDVNGNTCFFTIMLNTG